MRVDDISRFSSDRGIHDITYVKSKEGILSVVEE